MDTPFFRNGPWSTLDTAFRALGRQDLRGIQAVSHETWAQVDARGTGFTAVVAVLARPATRRPAAYENPLAPLTPAG